MTFPTISLITGCKGVPAHVVAYRAEAVTIATVDGAMLAWRDYVVAGNPVTQSQLDSVKTAYNQYYQSQIVSSNAFSNFYLANSTGDTNSLAVAQRNLNAALLTVGASEQNIITLINSFTKKGKAP